MKDIEKWAIKACELLKKKPIDQAEVFIVSGSITDVEIEKNKISSSAMHSNTTISMLAFCRGGRGKYSTTVDSEGDIEKAVNIVSAIAASAHPDPDFKTLPFPSKYPKAADLFDEKIASLEREKLFKWITGALEEALIEEPDIIMSGGVSLSSGQGFLTNTNLVAAG
ncbi:MAG: hypothetical protein PHW62_02495, partial [Candidatus Ratteibacteria bacterium]|nr:hypothetical protein [Candidatus Ratteibacteria bacterium]